MTRIALVTGGTRGIGAAIAKALRDDGKMVIVSYSGDADTARKFTSDTGITTYCWSVSDFDACQKNVREIEERVGSIEILVNNAGIIKDAMMHKMSLESWRQVIDTNLSGCFHMCRAVIAGMRDNQWGRIINISSVNALSGCMGQANYSASKAGIIGLTKSLALESASKGITVNAIAPGYIATDMTSSIPEAIRSRIIDQIPVKKMGNANDIARAVIFLASDDAGYITGSTLSINGGDYMQ